MEGDPAHIYRQLGSVVRLARDAYRPYTKEILALTGLSFVGGILEGIGINAVIPLLTFVLGLQSPATDAISEFIRSMFVALHIPFVPKFLLGFILALFVVRAFVSLYLSYIQILITTEYERATRARVFSKVLHASWPYLLRQKLGNLETLLMIDVPISTSLLWKISTTITVITSVLMYLTVAFNISVLITLVTLVLGALAFVFLRPLLSRVHALSRARASTYRDTVHHVTEHVSGLKSVKALGVEEAAVRRGNALFQDIKQSGARIQLLQQIAAQCIPPIGIIYIAAILSLAFKTPFVSLAALPAILYLIYRIFNYLQLMQNNLQAVGEYIPHLERVVLYEKAAEETHESGKRGDRPFVFLRELSFRDVSFAYDEGHNVLSNVSFTVPKGSMVGIVGPSGAGKTTTVDLMLRLLEPTSGIIALDGVDAATVKYAEWRENIAYVSQEFFILHDTIRNNIRFYDDSISDDDIWEAARKAHIDERIRKMPEGLDAKVGESGIMLSAGERQRIVIARALARKPQLLILDEATSALDNESEAHIRRVIGELKGEVTIVAIAHRLSTIMNSDTLVVLDEGKVAETGSPKKLLADTDSYFYKVYTINQ